MPTPSEYSSPNKEEDAGLDGHWAAHVLRTLGRTGGVGVGVESLLFDRGLISFARLFQSYIMTKHIRLFTINPGTILQCVPLVTIWTVGRFKKNFRFT